MESPDRSLANAKWSNVNFPYSASRLIPSAAAEDAMVSLGDTTSHNRFVMCSLVIYILQNHFLARTKVYLRKGAIAKNGVG